MIKPCILWQNYQIRQNPYVRWCLVQASHRLVRSDETYRKFVAKISYKQGKKKAIVAMARNLATIVLKEKRNYEKEYKEKLVVCPDLYLKDPK